MKTTRLEAFSDGVIAIIITIMVLELKAPHDGSLQALRPLTPLLLGYVLSFIYVGIYWSNHHHLFQVTENVTGGILWANLHLLFWLSLFPFATEWIGENPTAMGPTVAYGLILLLAAIAYKILQSRIIAGQGGDSVLAQAVGVDWKGRLSPALYVVATAIAFYSPLLAQICYVGVAILWLVPDSRIEKRLAKNGSHD